MAWIAFALFFLALAAMVTFPFLSADPFWTWLVMYAAGFAFGAAIATFLWAAPERAVRLMARISRGVVAALRFLAVLITISGAVFGTLFVVALMREEARTSEFFASFLFNMVTLIVGWCGLLLSPAFVGTTARIDSPVFRTWALFGWMCASVATGFSLAVLGTAVIPDSGFSISIVLAIGTVLIATYGRQRLTLTERIMELERALARLFVALTAKSQEESSPALVEAALEIEAILTRRTRTAISLPPVEALSPGVQAVLFHGLARITGLPFREVLAAEADKLAAAIPSADAAKFAAFIWDVRRRTLRAPASIRASDKEKCEFESTTADGAPRDQHEYGDMVSIESA